MLWLIQFKYIMVFSDCQALKLSDRPIEMHPYPLKAFSTSILVVIENRCVPQDTYSGNIRVVIVSLIINVNCANSSCLICLIFVTLFYTVQ